MRRAFSQGPAALGILTVVALVWLAACAGKEDAMLASLHRPADPAVARIVLLYPAPVTGSNGMAQIKWNDGQSCDLPSGAYLVREVVPGDEALSVSFCGIPGSTPFHLKADEGHTYYLRILPYDSSLRGIVSGYPTEFPAKTEKPNIGPFKIEIIEKEAAWQLIGDLALEPDSHR